MILLELFIVILAILIGARLGGVGLGVMGALGVGVLTFGLGVQPTSPPVEVILIIAAVITAVGAMQTAGGLDYLVHSAERILRRHPTRINYLGPIVSYGFTVITGTGHITYSILPVIAEVAKDIGIRPERPLSVSAMAAHLGVTASPISAATVLLLSLTNPFGMELMDILLICIPATLVGLLLAAFVASKRGKELSEDPNYLARQDKVAKATTPKPSAMDSRSLFNAKLALALFIGGAVLIVLLGAFPELRPAWDSNGEVTRLSNVVMIEIVMLSVAALIILFCRIPANQVAKQSTFTAGMQAVIAIFGIAWLGDTFFQANIEVISKHIQQIVTNAPWTFGLALFALSVMLFSQAATIRALLPLGISLGIPAPLLVGMAPAANGLFFIPSYPIEVAAINFDQTGTTRIGRYLLNHSFMIPGLVGTFTAVIVGLLLAQLWLYGG